MPGLGDQVACREEGGVEVGEGGKIMTYKYENFVFAPEAVFSNAHCFPTTHTITQKFVFFPRNGYTLKMAKYKN